MDIESINDVQREISSAQHPANLSVRVRDSFLGQYYNQRLKKYRVIKLLASFIWRVIAFSYRCAWLAWKAPKRQIIPLRIFASPKGKRIILSKAETVATPLPGIFPKTGSSHIIRPHTDYKFPELYVADLNNVLITGGTNLIMAEHSVICHDLYDFSRDFTSEELNGRAVIWPRRKLFAWLTRTTSTHNFDRAACFTDSCAHNYAHWLTEVLPRINLFCRLEKYQDVPLVIDAELHSNLMESLHKVIGSKRKVITVPTGVSLMVDNLSLISATGYVPFERRSKRTKDHSHGRFSPSALRSLRECFLGSMERKAVAEAHKLYVKRNSSIRNIANAKEVEEHLIACGFIVVEPELMTHGQQVELFHSAELIVGATGAAMANLIFCRPTSRIIILISDYKFMPYWYWQNMACAVGNRVTYVIGKCAGIRSDLHSDFRINMTDLDNSLIDTMSHQLS
jgi:capsular polysaccharide biosynthesis protein